MISGRLETVSLHLARRAPFSHVAAEAIPTTHVRQQTRRQWSRGLPLLRDLLANQLAIIESTIQVDIRLANRLTPGR